MSVKTGQVQAQPYSAAMCRTRTTALAWPPAPRRLGAGHRVYPAGLPQAHGNSDADEGNATNPFRQSAGGGARGSTGSRDPGVDPKRNLSSISQGTDVERQPRPDCQAPPETNNQSLARVARAEPDNFLYVFKPGPTGARKRAATEGRAVSALRSRFASAPGGGPWLGAHVPNGAARRYEIRHQRTALWAPVAGYPRWWLTRFCRLTVDLGLRIAPLAIMGSAVRPGTRQAAPRSSKLDP
jgi:hypothetical protein